MKRHAVILDDDPLVASLLEGVLGRRGYEVSAFANPTACPLFCENTCPCSLSGACPDIILTDYDMPSVNGIELIESVRRKNCKCAHLVLLSGSAIHPTELKKAASLGVTFIAKPFHVNQVHACLDKLENATTGDSVSPQAPVRPSC